MVHTFYSYGIVYFIFYALTLLSFLNSSSLLVSWILLELNILSFCVLLFFYLENFASIFYYFLIQSFGSFILLFYLIYGEQSSSSFHIIFILSLVIKLGFFPFQFWFYSVSLSFGVFSFFLLLTWQKIPGMVVLFNSHSDILFYLFVINGIFGSAIVFFSSNLVVLLVSSSIYIGYWNMVIYCFFPSIFLYFYIFYITTLAIAFFYILFDNGPLAYSSVAVLVFFLIGLPPFNIFFLNVYFLALIASCASFDLLFYILGVSFTCMIGYFSLFSNNLLYSHNLECSSSTLLFLIKSSFFFLIFCMLAFC